MATPKMRSLSIFRDRGRFSLDLELVARFLFVSQSYARQGS
jgi:hypothetical protein